MKYKAIILAFLLVLPLGALTSVVKAGFPNPQPQGYPPVLWVDMNNSGTYGSPTALSSLKLWGPCIVSTNFPVDVKLWNDPSLTLNDVFAFDFLLSWNPPGSAYPNDPHISLVSIATHLPANWVVVAQDTLAAAKASSSFHFAATDVAPNPGILVAANISLVTLTFHVDDEPLDGDFFTTPFTLSNVLMSGDGTAPKQLNPEIDNGYYEIDTYAPDIHLGTAGMLGPIPKGLGLPNPGDYYYTENAIGVTHTITVCLSNITHAFAFSITVTWDSPLYKTTDIQHVRIGSDWILANYAYETIVVTANSITVTLIRPLPPDKPLICSGISKCSEAFEFDLTSQSPDPAAMNIPTAHNTTISITGAWVLEMCDYAPWTGLAYEFAYGVAPPMVYTGNVWLDPVPLTYSCDLLNMFVPKTWDLLEDDGTVTVKDLTAIINEYGKAAGWAHLADPITNTGLVDIFDIVTVAKHMNDP